MSIDFKVIAAALDPESCCQEWLSDGKKRGAEWVASNPMRADRKPGSFSVNLNTGLWADFADKGTSGHDMVSLYAYLKCGGNQVEAARALAEKHAITVDADARERAARKVSDIADQQPRIVLPVPDGVPEPSFRHGTFGQPSRVWEYRDANGALLLYIVRFDPADMRKQIVPKSWCDHPGKPARWTWRGINGSAKRPIYGLDRLAAAPDADVVMVEGEKAADAAHAMLDGRAVGISWLGGVESADKVSLKALAGRRVVLWPDFDSQHEPLTKAEKDSGIDSASKPLLPIYQQPGVRAMLSIAEGLKGIAREIVMVGYTPQDAGGTYPAGWDLADGQDEGWTGERIMAHVVAFGRDPLAIARGEPLEPAAGSEDDAEDTGPAIGHDESVNPYGFPHLSDRGAPKNTRENLEYLLGQYGIQVRKNLVRRTVEVSFLGVQFGADDRLNNSITEIGSLCARNSMPDSKAFDYLKVIADKHQYCPVRSWIESKPWDGLSRIGDLLATVSTSGDAKLKDALMYRWLVSAVAALYKPFGFEAHGALVFVGEQGKGKTSWAKRLVPEEMGVVLTGAILDPANKDTVINAVSHWIVELGELDATFRKADIARLKSFVTQSTDKVRAPYDRVPSEYQRRTVFFASVNDERYLVDTTGNRRWWTVTVSDVDYMHDIDMQQVWAELLTVFRSGEQWHLTAAENAALSSLNEEHGAVDPVEELVYGAFDFSRPGAGSAMTATDVLLIIGYDKPNKAQATQMSTLLRKLTGAEARKSTGGRRVFAMPPRASNAYSRWASV